MEPRRLEMLLSLSRLGSMRLVAEELGVTTSTVSQQLAALAREVRTPLLEPEGRRVRLTPAGKRLAEHAVTILAAHEAARLDLDPSADPSGDLCVASFSSAARRYLLPLVTDLCRTWPEVRLRVLEHEPAEALDLLARDEADVAITYDYTLAPATFPRSLRARVLDRVPWGLAVPADEVATGTSPEVFAAYADDPWIVNSRNTADDEALHAIAVLAGFTPRITHRADSLELVQDMVAAGLGVGLLPEAWPARDRVVVVPLHDPGVELRSYVVTRRGREGWAPLALLLRLLRERAAG